jgi:outer membrane protein TolC
MKVLEVQIVSFIFNAIFLAATVLAQEPRPLSLSEAIQISLENNRQLKAARQQQEAAKSGVGQAKGALLPRLDIIEGFTYSDKPTLVFSNLLDQGSFKQQNFAIGSLNSPTPLTNLASQVRLEQPVYAGGKLLANVRQAQASADAAEQMTKRTQQEVIAQVIDAYYQVLLSQGNLQVVDKALASAHADVDRTKDLLDKGLVARSDYLRTQVLSGTLERERFEAESLVTTSHSRLQHVMGAEAGKFLPTEAVVEDRLPPGDLPALIAEAKTNRPDLKAVERETDRASAGVDAARAEYYPSLAFSTQFEGDTQKFTHSAENFAVFVTARWNLFNGFATEQKVSEARALLNRATLLREDLSHALALEVEQSYLALQAARRQVSVAKENVGQAEESLRILKDRYGAGLAKNLDVLDGETALKKAEQDLLQSQVNTKIFRARLDLAVGRPQ